MASTKYATGHDYASIVGNLLNYTTNRILEIPQDIKVELNENAQLVLKAGSKIWYPDGFEADGVTKKFSSITITEDTVSGRYGAGRDACIVVYSFNEVHRIEWSKTINFFSGGTQPTDNWYVWYDITSNRVKLHDGIRGYDADVTFPFCIISENPAVTSGGTDGGVKSINQIFNGFGYIGATAFALPGAKYQFADGRNEDGTFKSHNKTSDKVSVVSYDYRIVDTERQCLTVDSNCNLARNGYPYCQVVPPTTTDAYWYNPKENITYYTSHTSPVTYTRYDRVVVARDITNDSNFRITSFEPEVVEPINVYTRDVLASMGMPSSRNIKLTMGTNGTKYIAPANGWFAGNFVCSKAGSWCVLETRTKHIKSYSTANVNNGEVWFLLPVTTGDIVSLGIDSTATYTTDSARPGFYFIYAIGES